MDNMNRKSVQRRIEIMRTANNVKILSVGDTVEVLPGTMAALTARGFVADYMTESVDGMIGTIVEDFRDVVGCPHLGVELSFSHPVGIPEEFLVSR